MTAIGYITLLALSHYSHPLWYIHNEGPTYLNEVSFMVPLEVSGKHCCDAVIIGSNTLLTAASCSHCLIEGTIRSGITETIQKSNNIHNITLANVHPREDCKFTSMCNDIMTINVSPGFDKQLIKPISLAENISDSQQPGTHVINWFNDNGDDNSKLYYSTTSLVNQTTCQENYAGSVTEEYICFKNEQKNRKYICPGVAGSAVVLKNKLLGILSNEKGCSVKNNLPCIFTNIAHYTKWIQSQL